MFKKLVKLISEISGEESFNVACGEINRAFDHDKISCAEHNLLHELASKIKR